MLKMQIRTGKMVTFTFKKKQQLFANTYTRKQRPFSVLSSGQLYQDRLDHNSVSRRLLERRGTASYNHTDNPPSLPPSNYQYLPPSSKDL